MLLHYFSSSNRQKVYITMPGSRITITAASFLLLMALTTSALLTPDRSRRQTVDQGSNSVDDDIFAVARCRVSCLLSSTKLNNASSNKFQSLADLMESEDPTASMCWETCQLLIENWWTWHYMCDQYRLCLPGCQKACQFVMALRDQSEKKFVGVDAKMKKQQCIDTSNVVGFSNIKWTCDAQDTFRGCQISWGYPLVLENNVRGSDEICSMPPEQSLVYVIFYNEDNVQPSSAAPSISNNAEGVFVFKQQTFRSAAMTFESSITLTNGDEAGEGNNQIQDGPRIATDSQHYHRSSATETGVVRQRRGFFFQIAAVSSLGVVANSQTQLIRSGTYGLSPPYFPPARLTPTVILKNVDLGLSAHLSWRYPLPFSNNNTQSGFNEIQLVWRRHSCNVEPTFPTCELVPRTWSVQLDPGSTNLDFALPNLTYNSAYELYVAMAGANSSRVLITTPGCFSPDRTFRRCLPTTLIKEQAGYENKNMSLIISLVATSIVVVVTALVVGLFLYFRLYRQTKPTTASEMVNHNEPVIPPILRPGMVPGASDDYAEYGLTTNYHPRSTGRDSAYDSYVGSVHQLSMMGMFRDQWEISESQLTFQKKASSSEAVDVFRGVLGRETVWIKCLKSSSPDWRDHFLNELAILKMLERHANILNVVACITTNPQSPPLVVLEYFPNSLSLADYWTIIQRIFLHSKDKTLHRRRQNTKPDVIEEASLAGEDGENEPDIDALTMALQSQTQLDFMRQIAAGLAHIHSHQFTHGCLEPYNSILISVEARLVKITGIGSSSNLAKLVNSLHPEYNIERYLSPECGLANPIRTKQGDIWSFAIICWQMASFGAPPYLEIPPEKLTQCVTSGFKLEQPAAASNKLYELLLRCWDSLPHRRPSFQDVLVDLHTLLNSNYRHVDYNRILSSAIPVQMITPMLPEPVDPPRPSVAENDDDSVFDGSTLPRHQVVDAAMNLLPPPQKCVKIRSPMTSTTNNETALGSDHV